MALRSGAQSLRVVRLTGQTCVVLIGLHAWLLAACDSSGEGGAAGTGGAQLTGGAAGTAGSAGGGGTAAVDLFADPSVPECASTGTWKLTGSVGSETVMLGSDIATSNIEFGRLYVAGFGPNGGITIGDTYHPLILSWEGSVMKGASKPLTGTRFLMPGGDPQTPGGFCIVSGDIGPTTHSPGVLIKFRVHAVQTYANGACSGAELPATLVGCMMRSNEYLP